MAPAAATPLPDLSDVAHAASLDEPGLPLHRSSLPGSDLRIPNFSADLGSTHRQRRLVYPVGFATLLGRSGKTPCPP